MLLTHIFLIHANTCISTCSECTHTHKHTYTHTHTHTATTSPPLTCTHQIAFLHKGNLEQGHKRAGKKRQDTNERTRTQESKHTREQAQKRARTSGHKRARTQTKPGARPADNSWVHLGASTRRLLTHLLLTHLLCIFLGAWAEAVLARRPAT